MGGGSDGGGTQIIQPPVNNATPLQGPLINAATVALSSNDNMNPWGAGYRLTPNVPFGQVMFPGPNQTIYGNPFGSDSTPFFGQPSVSQAQVNAGMGAGGGQAAGQGPQQGMNGFQMPLIPSQQGQYQQVMAPFQQMFPGIFPQSGTPSPFSGYQMQPAPAPQQQNQAQMAPQQQQNQPQNQGNSGQQAPQTQAPAAQQGPKQGDPGSAPPAAPQLNPQQLAMQQQWIQQLQAAGANPYQGINPQTGMLM